MINKKLVREVFNYFYTRYGNVEIAKLNTSLNLNIPIPYLDQYLG